MSPCEDAHRVTRRNYGEQRQSRRLRQLPPEVAMMDTPEPRRRRRQPPPPAAADEPAPRRARKEESPPPPPPRQRRRQRAEDPPGGDDEPPRRRGRREESPPPPLPPPPPDDRVIVVAEVHDEPIPRHIPDAPPVQAPLRPILRRREGDLAPIYQGRIRDRPEMTAERRRARDRVLRNDRRRANQDWTRFSIPDEDPPRTVQFAIEDTGK